MLHIFLCYNVIDRLDLVGFFSSMKERYRLPIDNLCQSLTVSIRMFVRREKEGDLT